MFIFLKVISSTVVSCRVKKENKQSSIKCQSIVPSLAARRGDWSVWDGVLYDSDELPARYKRINY